MFRNIPLFAFVFSAVFASCTRGNDFPRPAVSDISAFSTRPLSDSVMKIVKLREAPVFQSRKSMDEQDAAMQRILREQESAERYIAQIAPNAKILFRYRFVCNGFAVVATKEDMRKISEIVGVGNVFETAHFLPPTTTQMAQSREALKSVVNEMTSTKFIGAEALHQRGYRGKGVRVGIIDTGIDYTHKMFGGAGTPEAYKKNNPALIESGTFPTQKVVGGIDLVGTSYLKLGELEVPQPDANPLDEAGHGTHVAGTVAGVGDNFYTYDGVAPEASLYAIKVFPAAGSTYDAIVIAGLEYALDPNQDLKSDDKLDVVNLSLGSSYGERYGAYVEAFNNLYHADVAAAISAGNSGNIPYIVGNPGASTQSQMSVAASVDNDPIHWKSRKSRFVVDGITSDVEVAGALFGAPYDKCDGCSGNLVYAGNAATDFDDNLKSKLVGNVALIDRGVVPFVDKVRRAAEAGAVGVVVVNNRAGAPVPMPGELDVGIPSIMIDAKFGEELKKTLQNAQARVEFSGPFFVEHPEYIDQITTFSSRGPRVSDGVIKPEISAPGQLIISAAMGKGNESVRLNGTSMAAPHMAGVFALLRNVHPNISVDEMRSRVMNTAKILTNGGKFVDVAQQGSGRVRVDAAANASTLITPQAISLGFISDVQRLVERTIVLENRSSEEQIYAMSSEQKPGALVKLPESVRVPAFSKAQVVVRFEFDKSMDGEFDGFVIARRSNGDVVASLPFLATLDKSSLLEVTNAVTPGGDVVVRNASPASAADFMEFMYLGSSPRYSPYAIANSLFNPSCDLRSAGVRRVSVERNVGGEAKLVERLQFAFEVAAPLNAWVSCEPSVLFDTNGDGVADKEVVGAYDASFYNAGGQPIAAGGTAASVMFDFGKKEAKIAGDLGVIFRGKVIVVELDPAQVVGVNGHDVAVKLALQAGEESSTDDFLNGGRWTNVSSVPVVSAAKTSLAAGSAQKVRAESYSKVIYFPKNFASASRYVVPAKLN